MNPSEPFPITLAFPPQGHFTQPHLAIPCLTAWLRQAGFEDVEQLDLSIEAYDHLLSQGELARAAQRVAECCPLDPTGGAEQLGFADMRAYRAAAETAASAEVLIDRHAELLGRRWGGEAQPLPAQLQELIDEARGALGARASECTAIKESDPS